MSDGKKFEMKFKEDWKRSFPGGDITRLPDQLSGFKSTGQNISDFICYNYPYLFYIECKSHKGNTFPLDCLSQYEKLLGKAGKKGVRAGVVIWFIEHPNCVIYVPVRTFKKLKDDGKKSFNVKMINKDEYEHLVIPSIQKIKFCESDYSVLMNLKEGW